MGKEEIKEKKKVLENEIPTIEEMRKKALEFSEGIPNLKQKQEFMTRIRGFTIEFSIIIEMCFNNLISATGKEMVFDHENKSLYLIKGKRTKKTLHPSFKTKSRDMKELIEEAFPSFKEDDLKNFLDNLYRFLAIRDIFAHVPVKWDSEPLEFNKEIPYKNFFKLNSKWKDVLFAHKEFVGLFQWIIDMMLHYNRNILLKKEIYSQILLGKSQDEIEEEAKKMAGAGNEI